MADSRVWPATCQRVVALGLIKYVPAPSCLDNLIKAGTLGGALALRIICAESGGVALKSFAQRVATAEN